MTKKKMRKLIVTGMLIFFVAGMLLNYLVAFWLEGEKFSDNVLSFLDSQYIMQMDEQFDDEMLSKNPYQSYEEHPEYFKMLYLHFYSSRMQNLDYPYSLAIVDRQGNFSFASDNFIYVRDDNFDDLYVDIEPYLTDELRKDMKKFLRKESNKYMQGIEKLSLYFDGEKYIPVKMTMRLRTDEETREFVFTDYEPTLVLTRDETIYMLSCFNELNYKFYQRAYLDSLKERNRNHYEMNKDNLNFDYGGGHSYSVNRFDGSMGVRAGEGYEVFYCFANNNAITTLLSEDFHTLTLYLAFLFAVAGIVFYIMSMKVIDKSERLEQAKRTFISAASHELKTPLSVIQNQCECIMENVAPEKDEAYVRSIYDEALRMNSIVTSLIGYNKISQLTQIKKESCNLSELLRQEVKAYGAFAESNGVCIEENIADDIYVDCDAQLMKMAIDNYLSNAVKYAVGDKMVEVNLFRSKDAFTLAVINPAEKESARLADEAWDEFSRGDKARQRQGASIGMGLAICKKIFELHSFSGYCKYAEGKISFVITGK